MVTTSCFGFGDHVAVAVLAGDVDRARDAGDRPRSSSARPGRRNSWCRRRGSAPPRCRAAPSSASSPNSCAREAAGRSRASMVSAIARGCSWISFCMKCRYGPSSSDASETSETCTSRSHFVAVARRTRAPPSRVSSAVSPSSRKITRRVDDTIAEHVGRDEVLALAQADQQRAAHARGDHAVGIALVDHRDRVGAVQFARPPSAAPAAGQRLARGSGGSGGR